MKEGHVHDQQGDDPYHKDYYNLMEREGEKMSENDMKTKPSV